MLQIVMLMLAQDIGPPGDEPAPPRASITRQRQCQPGEDDDIVVCGQGLQSQRIERLPAWSERPAFQPAGVRLSPNKTISATAEEGQNPFSSTPRAMIKFTLDF